MNKQEAELLNITLEECAEVTQAISKIFRFGWASCHPSTPGLTNRDHFEEEVGDLLCMIQLLEKQNLINGDNVRQAAKNKLNKLAKWSCVDVNNSGE